MISSFDRGRSSHGPSWMKWLFPVQGTPQLHSGSREMMINGVFGIQLKFAPFHQFKPLERIDRDFYQWIEMVVNWRRRSNWFCCPCDHWFVNWTWSGSGTLKKGVKIPPNVSPSILRRRILYMIVHWSNNNNIRDLLHFIRFGVVDWIGICILIVGGEDTTIHILHWGLVFSFLP